VGAAVVIGMLWASTPASASTVTSNGSTGPDATFFVEYQAARGERNRVTVKFGAATTIVDRGVRRIHVPRGFGCRATSRRRVVCDEPIVFLRLRDRDDTVHFVPGGDKPDPPRTDPFALSEDYSSYYDDQGGIDATTIVEAGRGNDTVTGSNGVDWISPGPGRDRIDTRGGADQVDITPDGARDRIRSGGGIDGLYYGLTQVPLAVDLENGITGAAGEGDRVSGFERVHAGAGDDTIRGSDRAEALYGEAGVDRIEGAGGNDLVTGDAPTSETASMNVLSGGDGNDVIDARGATFAPTTQVDCGPGNDVETGEVDDLLAPGCESVAFRVRADTIVEEDLPERPYQKALPVAVAPDGTPTFEIRCPSEVSSVVSGCSGTVALEQPDRPDAGPVYGSGPFDIPAGERAEVRVDLTGAGREAIARGEPVAVHVTAQPADFGWQTVIPR
jgi:hypothetical protein